MIQVRRNVFETNSSSTHSITICTEDEYEMWKRGEIYWCRWRENFVSKEEVIDSWNKYCSKYYADEEGDFDEWLIEEGYYTFDRYDDIEMETYEEHYQTKSGDKIIVFGYYGYDG